MPLTKLTPETLIRPIKNLFCAGSDISSIAFFVANLVESRGSLFRVRGFESVITDQLGYHIISA